MSINGRIYVAQAVAGAALAGAVMLAVEPPSEEAWSMRNLVSVAVPFPSYVVSRAFDNRGVVGGMLRDLTFSYTGFVAGIQAAVLVACLCTWNGLAGVVLLSLGLTELIMLKGVWSYQVMESEHQNQVAPLPIHQHWNPNRVHINNIGG